MDLRKSVCIPAIFLFSVNLFAAPKLRLSTTAVGPVQAAQGANPINVPIVDAVNVGDGTMNPAVTVSPSATWLTATVGTARPCGLAAQCYPIQFTLTTSNLSPGSYTGRVTVSDPNAVDAPQTIVVTAQVGTTVPDAISFFAPVGGDPVTATIQTASKVTSSVTTTGPLGFLSLVLQGGGSFSFNIPYAVTVQPKNLTAGTYTGTITTSGSTLAADNKTMNVTVNVTSSPIAKASMSDNGICNLTAPDNTQGLTGSVYCHIAAGAPKQTNYIFLTNVGQGTLTISSATAATTSGANWLSASTPAGFGGIGFTIDTTGLAAGAYQGTLTVTTNAANSPQTIPVQLDVNAATGPVAFLNGARNNATFAGGEDVAQGDIVALFGEQLTTADPSVAASLPLQTNFGTIQVLVNGVAAPLYYTSYNQINLQIPFEAKLGPGTIQVVRNGQAGNTISVNIVHGAPRILRLNVQDYGIIVNRDGSFPIPSAIKVSGFATHPAKVGDALVIYAIGLGPTNPAVASGVGSPAQEPFGRVTATNNVIFGGGFAGAKVAKPLFVGLTPNFVGLYQINVVVPDGTPKGDNVDVALSGTDGLSNTVQIAVQ